MPIGFSRKTAFPDLTATCNRSMWIIGGEPRLPHPPSDPRTRMLARQSRRLQTAGHFSRLRNLRIRNRVQVRLRDRVLPLSVVCFRRVLPASITGA